MTRLWINLTVITAAISMLAGGRIAGAQDETSRPAAKTYVGQLAKAPGSAKIALIVQNKEFLAYVCGKDDDFLATHARWFRGAVEDGKLSAAADGAKLTAEVVDEKAQGVLIGSDKSKIEFTATAVKTGGKAGLYRDEVVIGDEHHVAGWIRGEDGETVGATNTGGKSGQVKPPVARKGGTKKVGTADPGAPPAGSVGTGDTAQNVQGKRVNDITGPLLPGQIFKVAALSNVDLTKKQFTVQDAAGKKITLPTTNVVLRSADGQDVPVEPRSLNLNIRIGKTRVTVEQDDNGKRRVVITRE